MQSTHIKPLTGVRFFAAAWVVLHHFHPWMLMLCPALKWCDGFTKLGYEAVPFFFLLSGFILSHNYLSDYSLAKHPRFIFLRFARLWPVHAVTLFLLILTPGMLAMNGDRLKSLVEELLMVRSWFESTAMWNAPAWSISAEWFAYIFVFPLAYFLLRRIRSAAVLAVLVTLCLAAQTSPLRNYIPNRCGAIFFLFLAGCGLYQLRRQSTKVPAVAIVNTGLILFAAYILFNKYLSEFFLYAAFALLIFGLSYERGSLARLLSTRAIVYGGLASYSLYMTHYVIMQTYIGYTWAYWKTIPNLPLVFRLGILLFIAVVFLGAAVLSYRYVEEPANRKLRGFWRPTKTVSAGGAVGATG